MLLESEMLGKNGYLLESGSYFSEDVGASFFFICLRAQLLPAIRRFSARNDDSSPSP
jgi:hypothetical protein